MVAVKPLLIACLIFVFASCGNDEVTPGETDNALLTRISRDGITQMELFYDIDENLYRMDYYFGGALSTYTLYEYNEMGIKESRRYDAGDHSLEYRRILTLDNFGRIIKSENHSLPDLSKVASITEYGYNTSGRLITDEFRLPGQAVYSLEEFGYDDQGNLITRTGTVYPGQKDEYMSYHYEYVPGSRSIPDHWGIYLLILGMSGVDEGIRNMFYSGYVTKSWNSNQELFTEFNYETSGHEFNSDGSLIRLIMTRKNIKNPENPDLTWEMTYEYAR